MSETAEIEVVTCIPHHHQELFITSKAKRKIIRAGRRGGKTVGMAILGVEKFLEGQRVLYTAPTGEQTEAWWHEVTNSLRALVETGAYKENKSESYIEKVGTKNRIKAKTAWNANTLRGDYADLIIFDEWQLTAEDAWDEIGQPMLLDNNGDAVFIYTPPSLRSSGISRARDPLHAAKMFKKFSEDETLQEDGTRMYETFHFTSFDNPHIDSIALAAIVDGMSTDAYWREIKAEDDDAQLNLLVYSFDDKICKVPRFEIDKNWDIYVGHDFGSANPAALFAAVDFVGNIYLWHEYCPKMGKSTYQNVQAFKEIIKLEDSTRDVRMRLGGSHQEDEIRQGYAVQSWPIIEPHTTKVMAQIDRVKQLFEKKRIFIFEDMYQIIDQLNSCMWELDDMGQPTRKKIKDEKKYHLLACLRYLCTAFAPEREIIPQRETLPVLVPQG